MVPQNIFHDLAGLALEFGCDLVATFCHIDAGLAMGTRIDLRLRTHKIGYGIRQRSEGRVEYSPYSRIQ